jgi:hypothetical protein
MKVAKYEVLGIMQKRDVRPVRDDRSVLVPGPLVCGFTSVKRSIVPSGTGHFFCIIPSTSYWATFTGSLRDKGLDIGLVDARARPRGGLLSLGPSGTTALDLRLSALAELSLEKHYRSSGAKHL